MWVSRAIQVPYSLLVLAMLCSTIIRNRLIKLEKQLLIVAVQPKCYSAMYGRQASNGMWPMCLFKVSCPPLLPLSEGVHICTSEWYFWAFFFFAWIVLQKNTWITIKGTYFVALFDSFGDHSCCNFPAASKYNCNKILDTCLLHMFFSLTFPHLQSSDFFISCCPHRQCPSTPCAFIMRPFLTILGSSILIICMSTHPPQRNKEMPEFTVVNHAFSTLFTSCCILVHRTLLSRRLKSLLRPRMYWFLLEYIPDFNYFLIIKIS